MTFNLDRIVPWGRSFEEYVRMFSLTEPDLQSRILGCGDGPAAFNASLTRQGGQVVSVDPIYRFTAEEIQQRIDDTFVEVVEQTRKNRDSFLWDQIGSVDELGQLRMAAMQTFLEDYQEGRNNGRYRAAELPTLPFREKSFDLALCSHLLFLYSDHLDRDFHLASIRELCRVAKEVRIFPLVDLKGSPSRHLDSVVATLLNQDFAVEQDEVPYEFQKGGNRMLRVTPPK